MYKYRSSYDRAEADRTLYAAACVAIKIHPKYMSRWKLQALMYFAAKEHLSQYGRMIVDYSFFACKQGPYMPRLDKVLTPGFFLKYNPRLDYS